MSNLALIMKTNIINETGINKLRYSSREEKLKIIPLTTLILLSFILIGVYGFKLCFYLSDFLMQIGQMELLIVIGVIGSVCMTLFISTYKASSYLFQSKDYEMLASLPLKKSTLLISKVLYLILHNYVFSLVFVLIPAIVYFIKMDTGVFYIPYLIILSCTLPLIPTIIASVIGFFIGKVSIRAKNNNFMMILLNMILVVGILVISFNFQEIALNIIENSSSIIEVTQKVYFPAYYFIDALINNSFISLMIFVLVSVIPIIIFTMVFTNSFSKISSKMTENHIQNNYEIDTLNTSKPVVALLNREFKRYISSTIYVINTLVGIVLLAIFALVICIKGFDEVAAMLDIETIENMLKFQVIGIVAFCVTLTNSASVSISLEGKSLWILKSVPLQEIDIFKSKIYLNMILVVPVAVVSFLAIGINLNFDIQMILLAIISIILLSFFNSSLGLFINLLYPKLEFSSDVEVVKRSASVILTLISSALTLLVICLPIYFVGIMDINLILIYVNVILFVLSMTLWKMIKTKGVILFRKL